MLQFSQFFTFTTCSRSIEPQDTEGQASEEEPFASGDDFVSLPQSDDDVGGPSYKEGDEESEEDEDNALKQMTRDFNEKLRERPNDVDLWLEFVAFQDKFFMGRADASTAEKKLSILKRALEENPTSTALIRAYLATASLLYEYVHEIFSLTSSMMTCNHPTNTYVHFIHPFITHHYTLTYPHHPLASLTAQHIHHTLSITVTCTAYVYMAVTYYMP